MADQQMQTYLNHHIAGTVAALEALEHLGTLQRGTPLERTFVELQAEVAADRRMLEELMTRLKITESGAGKATAWLGEKMARLRLQLDERKSRALHLLEALEALSLGLEGKRLLWISLAAAALENPALAGLDYQLMVGRAEEQRRRVEKLRVDAARNALHAAG